MVAPALDTSTEALSIEVGDEPTVTCSRVVMEYHKQASLIAPPSFDGCSLLKGANRRVAEKQVREKHYTHSVPSGKTHFLRYESAIISYSIPANPNAKSFFLGENIEGEVWELSRLWAPDDHRHNLLTQAISRSLTVLVEIEPSVVACIAYADPNVGHSGGVYRAASWMYCGQSEEGRYYQDEDGQVVSRRKFHSGNEHLTKDEILDYGYTETKRAGKQRFAKGMTKKARKHLRSKFKEHVWSKSC